MDKKSVINATLPPMGTFLHRSCPCRESLSRFGETRLKKKNLRHLAFLDLSDVRDSKSVLNKIQKELCWGTPGC